MDLSAVFYLVNLLHIAHGSLKWTLWYNTDEPSNGEDIETLLRIQQIDNEVCKNGTPEDVECRVVGDEESTFDGRRTWKGNTLNLPCTINGITCYDIDQDRERKCFDYEIRFLCSHEEDGNITNNGAFIALSAGCSVLIPLICVLIIKCKKSRVSRNQQTTQTQTVQSPSCDLPPSYNQLFGSRNGSLAFRTTSTEDLLNSSRDLSNSYVSQSNATQSNDAASSQSNVSNPSQSNSSSDPSQSNVETISGSNVRDVTIGVNSGIDNYAYITHDVAPRRYPGMHISVMDLMNNTYLSNDQTPPPSYKEALEILKSAPHKA